ncbi:MAG: HNH endonuclease [Catonella sp.]|jgi:5-methylcytosine-specific restriction endonuclease McrA|nr:HNH endonuclease [Catonella sp.]MDY6357405.1 HNH endonuclease [Catonella sp.]
MSSAKILVYGPETGHHRIYLFFHGFRHDSGNRYIYFGKEKRCEKLARKCENKGMKAKYINEFTDRSANYRKIFFDNNRPYLFGLYICAYCGRLLPEDKVTVDHIYPVKIAQENPTIRKKLERKGYSSINDPRNLVCACSSCNERKSANTNGWIWKAKIGKNYFIWHIRKIIKFLICLVLIYLLLYALNCFGLIEVQLPSPEIIRSGRAVHLHLPSL